MSRCTLLIVPLLLLPLAAAAAPPPLQSTPPAAEPQQSTVPPEVPPVDHFKEALVNVYKNQPQLKAAREALKAEDENVAQAVSGFRPNVSAGYEKGRQRLDVNNQGWTYGNTSDKTITATQDIFNGGETWANFKSSRDRMKAARAQLTDTEQQVFFSAVLAYTDVVEKRLVLQANQNNADVLEKQLSDTKARFDVGDLTRTDVSQSEARLSQARADERQALGDYETARVIFKRVIGYDAPDDIAMPPLPPGLPQTLEEAVNWAQAANPSLEAARHLESAASTDVDARTGALLPDVSITGSMGRGEGLSVTGSGSRESDNDAVTLNVTIPLYQSGAEWSRIRQAKNQAQQAKFVTMDTHDAVIGTVTRAWHDFHTSQAVIVSTEEAVTAANLALEGVRQENMAGVRTVLDTLNAEQEAFLAKVNLVQAQALEKTQAYRLLAAVGKLTAEHLVLPVEHYDPKEHYDDVKYRLIGF